MLPGAVRAAMASDAMEGTYIVAGRHDLGVLKRYFNTGCGNVGGQCTALPACAQSQYNSYLIATLQFELLASTTATFCFATRILAHACIHHSKPHHEQRVPKGPAWREPDTGMANQGQEGLGGRRW